MAQYAATVIWRLLGLELGPQVHYQWCQTISLLNQRLRECLSSPSKTRPFDQLSGPPSVTLASLVMRASSALSCISLPTTHDFDGDRRHFDRYLIVSLFTENLNCPVLILAHSSAQHQRILTYSFFSGLATKARVIRRMFRSVRNFDNSASDLFFLNEGSAIDYICFKDAEEILIKVVPSYELSTRLFKLKTTSFYIDVSTVNNNRSNKGAWYLNMGIQTDSCGRWSTT